MFPGPQTPHYGHRVMSEQTPLLGHFMYRNVDLRAIEKTRGLVRLQQNLLTDPNTYIYTAHTVGEEQQQTVTCKSVTEFHNHKTIILFGWDPA